MKRLIAVTLVALFVVSATSVFALSPGQQKLLAKRAAQLDAYRNLAELIKGLHITSDTYVRDFVAESDQIKTEFDTFLKGAKIVGQPIYYEDGTCEVTVEITLQQIIQALKRIQETHHYIRSSVTHNFDQMVNIVKKKTFQAKGQGVPREEPMEVGYGPAPVPVPAVRPSPTSGIPGWEGVTARGRLMAERAAKVDAYRNLAETVKGLRISGSTYVRDFVAESDEIATRLDTFIKGVKQMGPYRYMPDAIVEVDVQVAIQTVVKEVTDIYRWYTHQRGPFRNTYLQKIRIEDIVQWYPKKYIQATGEGVAPEKYRSVPVVIEEVSVMTPVQPVAQSPSWARETIVAIGTGVPMEGQTGTEARLMAARAAEVDARRNLVEQVYGVYIDGETTVRDFVTVNDEVKAEVDTIVFGAVIGEPVFLEDGSVEVTAELPLDGLWGRIKKYRM